MSGETPATNAMPVQLRLFAPPPRRSPRRTAGLPACDPIGPDTCLHAAITAYNAHLAARNDLADASRYAMGRDLQVAGQILGMARAVGSLTHADLEQLVARLQATSSPATTARISTASPSKYHSLPSWRPPRRSAL